MSKATITIEWDKEQWFCYSDEFGKYACYGLGETETKALEDFINNARDFRECLKEKEGSDNKKCLKCGVTIFNHGSLCNACRINIKE